MLLNVLRWVFGYISFKATADTPEKLLNFIIKNKISIWNIKKEKNNLYANTLSSQYNFLCKKSNQINYKVEIVKKYGLPFFAFKYRKRLGILAGFLSFTIILHIFSLYIWNINIVGNKNIPSNEIVKTLQELGIKQGCKKSDINSSYLKQIIMSKLNDIAWISINLQGSCLNISIKEKIKSPQILQNNDSCNIVAAKDGQIDHLEIYKGTPCVNEGDAVIKGQVLINSSNTNPNNNSLSGETDGKVFAKTKIEIIEKTNLNQLNAIDSGKIIKKYKIEIFGKELPIKSFKKFDEEQFWAEHAENKLNFFGIKLPFIMHTDIYHEQICEEKTLNLEQAKDYLMQTINKKEENELKDVKIISKNIDIKENDNELIANATYICIENIAKKQNL